MDRCEILVCPAAKIKPALKTLHEELPSDQQLTLVQTLDQLHEMGTLDFSGLIVAQQAGELVAATWVQFTPGRAAAIWPPAMDSPMAAELLAKSGEILDEREIALAQILFSAEAAINEQVLQHGGFERLADLAYYTLEKASFAPRGPRINSLTFVPRANEYPSRFEAIIERSYLETLDCPRLNGLRTPAEVIDGYKIQGKFDPEKWFLVCNQQVDVGVLILTEHELGCVWELVYMGVVPEARGHGFGEEIVLYAVDLARQHDAERLVLAVDEQNSPALAMYERIGFTMWDRRTVYARLRSYSD